MAKEFHWACRDAKIARYHQDQLLRASSSVALNLAEGSAKRTELEQRRYYNIALASLRECEAILELERVESPELRKSVDGLGAILFTLSRSPENRNATGTEVDTVDAAKDGRLERTQ
jgi:four helix bundle protein